MLRRTLGSIVVLGTLALAPSAFPAATVHPALRTVNPRSGLSAPVLPPASISASFGPGPSGKSDGSRWSG